MARTLPKTSKGHKALSKGYASVTEDLPDSALEIPEHPKSRSQAEEKMAGSEFHKLMLPRKRTTVIDLLTDRVRMEKFLDFLRVGASWASAASAVKLMPETVTRWMKRGETAPKGPYRRFFKEVVNAIGEATAFAEADVKKSSPLVWLERGPGRFISPEWSDNAPGNSGAGFGSFNVQINQGSAAIPAAALQEAMKVLVDAGMDLNLLAQDQQVIDVPGRVIVGEGNPENPDGEVDYDDETMDVEVDNVGTNYAENGHWKTANPNIPSGLLPDYPGIARLPAEATPGNPPVPKLPTTVPPPSPSLPTIPGPSSPGLSPPPPSSDTLSASERFQRSLEALKRGITQLNKTPPQGVATQRVHGKATGTRQGNGKATGTHKIPKLPRPKEGYRVNPEPTPVPKSFKGKGRKK